MYPRVDTDPAHIPIRIAPQGWIIIVPAVPMATPPARVEF
jgi:hypothetical protein